MKRAFTLVETIIVIGILCLISVVLAGLFITYSSSFGHVQAVIDTAGEAGSVINYVSKYLRQADQVVPSRSFSGNPYTSNSDTLIISMPSIDSSGNLISGGKDYALFYKSGSEIYFIIESYAGSMRPTTNKRLSSTATSLGFTYDDVNVSSATKVEVSVSTQKQARDKLMQSSLHEQVYLRNK